jgi:Raf kinase inhibitor-like YbhB/YbcL family protein
MALLTALLMTVLPFAAQGTARAVRARTFRLSSSDLPPGATFSAAQTYDRGGCRGQNISPALTWRNPPAGTRSFALLMFDPDAPSGLWWHWLVFDLPADTRALPAGAGGPDGSLPAGAIQVRNDYGFRGYGGPCPPPGPAHHYHIALYALRVRRLHLDRNAPAETVATEVRAAALGEAEIIVPYGQ